MREKEIKFRGKRLDNGEWVYGDLLTHEGKSLNGVVIRDWGAKAQYYDIDPATVGQYTGLKDKHGREIYTGQQLRITMYDHWDGREIARQDSVVEFRDCKFGITWNRQFSGLDSFSHNVTFEVIDEETGKKGDVQK